VNELIAAFMLNYQEGFFAVEGHGILLELHYNFFKRRHSKIELRTKTKTPSLSHY
jgi:hypothetical protein